MTATKTKRKGIFLALPVLALLFLISTSMMSGTFAKYTSELAGKDTALVAKWDITANDNKGTELESSSVDLNLWEHANTHIDGNVGGKYLIAPGAHGTFTLNVINNSDVDASVVYTFSGRTGNPDVPLLFKLSSLDDTHWVTLEYLAAQIGESTVDIGDTLTKQVDWKWNFELDTDNDGLTSDEDTTDSTQRDVDDTLLGTTSATGDRTEYILDLTMTATQIAAD